MIVKIFFMDVLTQAYAHLEFNSKLKSASAMTWIDKTSMAQLPEENTDQEPEAKKEQIA